MNNKILLYFNWNHIYGVWNWLIVKFSIEEICVMKLRCVKDAILKMLYKCWHVAWFICLYRAIASVKNKSNYLSLLFDWQYSKKVFTISTRRLIHPSVFFFRSNEYSAISFCFTIWIFTLKYFSSSVFIAHSIRT